MQDGAAAYGGQQLLRILGQQYDRRVGRRLFEYLEQAIGRLFHKRSRGEDGEPAARLNRWTVVGRVDDLAHLAELDHQLRRVRRNDEQVRVRLDHDARFALVDVAHVFTGSDGFGNTLVQVHAVADPGAIVTATAKVGQAVRFGGLLAIHRLGEHERERVLPCPARAGKDHGLRKMAGADVSRRRVTVAALPRKSRKLT